MFFKLRLRVVFAVFEKGSVRVASRDYVILGCFAVCFFRVPWVVCRDDIVIVCVTFVLKGA